jgi:hypothetical protein
MGSVRRIGRVIPFTMAAVIGFVILVFAGLVVFQAIDKEDSFVLEKAELQAELYSKVAFEFRLS